VKRRKISFTLMVAAVLWSPAFGLPAQQATQSQTVKQEVPNNPLKPAAPAQPIPCSHKTHLALGLQCLGCHTNPDPGNQMAFPATSMCMTCHATVAKNKPAIRKLSEFAKSQKPIPWVRVYVVLSGVQWTHSAHLKAGMKCETCHGDVAQMDAMAETTSVTTMAVCINCHEMKKAKSTCNTCHLWP
jgi:hypothetical protein